GPAAARPTTPPTALPNHVVIVSSGPAIAHGRRGRRKVADGRWLSSLLPLSARMAGRDERLSPAAIRIDARESRAPRARQSARHLPRRSRPSADRRDRSYLSLRRRATGPDTGQRHRAD